MIKKFTPINIENILKDKNYDINKKISLSQFKNIIYKLNNNSSFDNDIIDQIFEEMIKNNNSNFSNLKKFCSVYIKAINSLEKKIEDIKEKIEENNLMNNKIDTKIKNNNIDIINEFNNLDYKIIFKLVEIKNFEDSEGTIEIKNGDITKNLDIQDEDNLIMYFFYFNN